MTSDALPTAGHGVTFRRAAGLVLAIFLATAPVGVAAQEAEADSAAAAQADSGAATEQAKAAGQEAAAGGPRQIGAFVYAVQGGEEGRPETRLLVVPDTASTLNEGARLFLRCRADRREVYVAVTDGNLGNAREGAGGQWRFDRRPWSELVRWGANEQGTAAFMPPRLYDTFVTRALESEVVEIRIVNVAGVRKRYVFPLEGLGKGLDRLGCFQEGES